MVRKRSRKYYDSDENDSDSDFDLDSPPASPAPKKYSLRQRKRAVFVDDFDYEEEGEEAVPKAPTDDEDYEVEMDLKENETTHYIDHSTFVNSIEPDAEVIAEDGLIDFEDVIRADVVVNKNRIDYDNVIHKTEIKVQPIGNKRGRKPKPKPEYYEDILEPEPNFEENYEQENFESCASKEDEDEPTLDPASLLQTELKEGEHHLPEPNNISEEPEEALEASEKSDPVVAEENIPNGEHKEPVVQNVPENEETETLKPELITDEDLLFNDLTEQERTKILEEANKEPEEEEEEVPADEPREESEENVKEELEEKVKEESDEKVKQEPKKEEVDDVILIEDEKESEVIVLDDD